MPRLLFSDMKKVKIYGERNTGTRYLSQLITGNLKVEQLRGVVPDTKFWKMNEFNKNLYFTQTSKFNLGWKHSFVDLATLQNHPDLNNIYFVTLSKNPYSFLLSLYKRPYHYKGTKPENFLQFLQARWLVQKRDNHDSTGYQNPIELWNSKNSSYMALKELLPEQTINIRYEDLLEHPETSISEFSDLSGIQKTPVFLNLLRSTKEQSKSFSYYQKF